MPRYTEKAKMLDIQVEAIPIIEFTAPTSQQIERFVHILTSATEVSIVQN
jgi:protein-tyrosine phosphatase